MKTRFAPSINGHLHLGHLYHLIVVAGHARKNDGKIILRLEDHDLGRFRPEYKTSTLADLEKIGFFALPEYEQDPSGIWQQSDHPATYQDILNQLIDRQLVYACSCSRKEIAKRYEQNRKPEQRQVTQITQETIQETIQETPYDGFCAERNLKDDHTTVLRVVVPEQLKRQCGDFILRDRLGQFSYQFCVVVDDIRQQISHIIRGEDLLSSTDRQLYLHHLMKPFFPDTKQSGIGEQEPLFIHHPLLLDKSGKKFSKRGKSKNIGPIIEEIGFSATVAQGLQRLDFKDRQAKHLVIDQFAKVSKRIANLSDVVDFWLDLGHI